LKGKSYDCIQELFNGDECLKDWQGRSSFQKGHAACAKVVVEVAEEARGKETTKNNVI